MIFQVSPDSIRNLDYRRIDGTLMLSETIEAKNLEHGENMGQMEESVTLLNYMNVYEVWRLKKIKFLVNLREMGLNF